MALECEHNNKSSLFWLNLYDGGIYSFRKSCTALRVAGLMLTRYATHCVACKTIDRSACATIFVASCQTMKAPTPTRSSSCPHQPAPCPPPAPALCCHARGPRHAIPDRGGAVAVAAVHCAEVHVAPGRAGGGAGVVGLAGVCGHAHPFAAAAASACPAVVGGLAGACAGAAAGVCRTPRAPKPAAAPHQSAGRCALGRGRGGGLGVSLVVQQRALCPGGRGHSGVCPHGGRFGPVDGGGGAVGAGRGGPRAARLGTTNMWANGWHSGCAS